MERRHTQRDAAAHAAAVAQGFTLALAAPQQHGGRRRIKSTYAQTWSFSSEGLLMYPLAKILCPPLRTLGVTPNMITIFNIFVGMGSGYALRALPKPARASLLPG